MEATYEGGRDNPLAKRTTDWEGGSIIEKAMSYGYKISNGCRGE